MSFDLDGAEFRRILKHAFFAKSFAYFAVRREIQSKTAKIAKAKTQSFRKENAFGLPNCPAT
jgi:hypothetical protein